MKCLICNNDFIAKTHFFDKHDISSKMYYDTYLKRENENKCNVCGATTKFVSVTKGYFRCCSKKCAQTGENNPWYNNGKARMGDKSPHWKGGITPIAKKARNSNEWKIWRNSVFERDNYSCRKCGKRGCMLHPHHVNSFSQFPEQRFVLENGLTLCEKCHRKTDNYGGKKK